jgi:hypothetical protein
MQRDDQDQVLLHEMYNIVVRCIHNREGLHVITPSFQQVSRSEVVSM